MRLFEYGLILLASNGRISARPLHGLSNIDPSSKCHKLCPRLGTSSGLPSATPSSRFKAAPTLTTTTDFVSLVTTTTSTAVQPASTTSAINASAIIPWSNNVEDQLPLIIQLAVPVVAAYLGAIPAGLVHFWLLHGELTALPPLQPMTINRLDEWMHFYRTLPLIKTLNGDSINNALGPAFDLVNSMQYGGYVPTQGEMLALDLVMESIIWHQRTATPLPLQKELAASVLQDIKLLNSHLRPSEIPNNGTVPSGPIPIDQAQSGFEKLNKGWGLTAEEILAIEALSIAATIGVAASAPTFLGNLGPVVPESIPPVPKSAVVKPPGSIKPPVISDPIPKLPAPKTPITPAIPKPPTPEAPITPASPPLKPIRPDLSPDRPLTEPSTPEIPPAIQKNAGSSSDTPPTPETPPAKPPSPEVPVEKPLGPPPTRHSPEVIPRPHSPDLSPPIPPSPELPPLPPSPESPAPQPRLPSVPPRLPPSPRLPPPPVSPGLPPLPPSPGSPPLVPDTPKLNDIPKPKPDSNPPKESLEDTKPKPNEGPKVIRPTGALTDEERARRLRYKQGEPFPDQPQWPKLSPAPPLGPKKKPLPPDWVNPVLNEVGDPLDRRPSLSSYRDKPPVDIERIDGRKRFRKAKEKFEPPQKPPNERFEPLEEQEDQRFKDKGKVVVIESREEVPEVIEKAEDKKTPFLGRVGVFFRKIIDNVAESMKDGVEVVKGDMKRMKGELRYIKDYVKHIHFDQRRWWRRRRRR